MIVPMKKVSLVTLSASIEETLKNLRKVGLIHLEYEDAKSPNLQELTERRSDAEKALAAIPQEPVPDGSDTPSEADAIIDRVLRITAQVRDLRDEADGINREYERYAPWGEFNPGDLSELAEHGLTVKLYQLTRDQFENIEGVRPYVISREKTVVRIALVGEELSDIPEMVPPSMSLGDMKKRKADIAESVDELETELGSFSTSRTEIEEKLAELDQAIEFERATLSMGDAGSLAHITGFVPEAKIQKISAAAKKHAWALLIGDPDEEDIVPVLLENKKPVRIISPMFDLLGALPGYREYDISFWFLLFFTLFFAMIIGDAGYGLIFLGLSVLTVILRKAKGKAAGREMILFTVLSSATVIWGSLSGTWFGSRAIAEAAPFRYLVLEPISTFNPRSSEAVKYFCFIIGTAQIVLAHGWNFISYIRKKPRLKAFGELGWMVMVFGLFYLVLNLVLDPVAYPVPQFALYMIAGGLGFVVLFAGQDGKFFRGLLNGLKGLFQTFLDSIGAFADVISYIRLFAVGLATVEIAKSFNAMAADMGSSVVGLIGAILVLIIGHGINIVMGALSVIVHGVRLNMLEFSGHLNMEWSGISYTPFRERNGDSIETEQE